MFFFLSEKNSRIIIIIFAYSKPIRMDISISVIICTYNRGQLLNRTFEALVRQTLPTHEFEVILINNNSTDQTAEICLHFQQTHPEFPFRYFKEKQQGLSYARNRGIEESHSDLLVFLDDDAFAEPEYLQNIQIFFKTHPDAAAAGGRIYPEFETQRPPWMSHFMLSLASTLNLGEHVRLFKKKYPIGANMILRRSTIEKYGDFDVALGRRGNKLEGAEEKDLFYRIRRNGEKIYYIPQAIVYHFVSDKRLEFDYFKRQAIGIGYSEKVRAKRHSSREYLKSITLEIGKWGATFLLCLGYMFRLRFRAGWRLVIFRWYVSRGLFFTSKL